MPGDEPHDAARAAELAAMNDAELDAAIAEEMRAVVAALRGANPPNPARPAAVPRWAGRRGGRRGGPN